MYQTVSQGQRRARTHTRIGCSRHQKKKKKKAASFLFHHAGLALLACGNASRGNENTGKSLQLFFGGATAPAAARSHTHTRNRTHTCTPSAHVLRLRARVTHRDNRVNLKNINTGVRLQGCQGAAGDAGGRKSTLALHRELLDSFFVTLL